MKTFRRKEVEEITGIPARRIQFYTDSGLVTMDNLNPKRGNERLYLKSNLLELLVIKEFAKHGVELSKIRLLLFIPFVQQNMEAVTDIGEKLNNEKFSVDSYGARYISVYGDGRTMHMGSTANILEIDMSKNTSIFIVNITKLAEQLINL